MPEYRLVVATMEPDLQAFLNKKKNELAETLDLDVDERLDLLCKPIIQISDGVMLGGMRVHRLVFISDDSDLDVVVPAILQIMVADEEMFPHVMLVRDPSSYGADESLRRILASLEDRVREVFTMVLVSSSRARHRNVLAGLNVKPLGKVAKDARKIGQNALFHVSFAAYKSIVDEILHPRIENLLAALQNATTFEDFKTAAIVPLDTNLAGLLQTIATRLEQLEDLRNAFAHHRAPSETERFNAQAIIESLAPLLDNAIALLLPIVPSTSPPTNGHG